MWRGSTRWLSQRLTPTRKYFGSSASDLTASEVSLSQLPVVDIGPLVQARREERSVSWGEKEEILAQLKEACVMTGFFTIPTKGVLPSGLINQAYKRKDEFLHLPDDVKQKYHVKRSPNNKGWTPLFEEPSYQPGAVSYVEGFDLAKELPASFIREGSSLGPNNWPTELDNFQQDVYSLYEETSIVSSVLFQSFAEMLSLPSDTFEQHVGDEAEAFMRLLTYPEAPSKPDSSLVGISSHTDFECFTIIHQNGPGLHLRHRQGHWIQAPVCHDRLFILIGDMLERWTNGLLQATEHRVVNGKERRQSVVRFNGANGDAVIEPLPSFTVDTSPKYAPTTQREHVVAQISQAETYLKQAQK